MPIAPDVLDVIAESFAAPMSRIRGRRVRRLVNRVFAPYDQVRPMMSVLTRPPALIALNGHDGGLAICETDGRGPAAAVTVWAGPDAPGITHYYDLTKDSLPAIAAPPKAPSPPQLADILQFLSR
jgi:hypothetical protein